MKKQSLILIYLFFFLIIVFDLTHVSQSFSDSDLKIFHAMPTLNECQLARGSVEKIVNCISHTKSWLEEKIPNYDCQENPRIEIEPEQIISNRLGCCYARSRFLEKFLSYAGHQTRHVGIWIRHSNGKPNLLTKNTMSHALFEISTPKGWMLVGSLSHYIGIGENGDPLDAREFRDLFLVGEAEKVFPRQNGKGNFSIIYGLYSRHGYFFKPFVPLPDIIWSQFLRYFFDNSL